MARKFAFKFETVLKLRRQREQFSRQQLLQAQAAEVAALGALERLAEMLRKADRRAALRLARIGSLGVESAHMVSGLRAQAFRRQRHAKLQRETSRCRTQLVQDTRSRKVVGRLKERLGSRHRSAMLREEIREADDLHTMFTAAHRADALSHAVEMLA